jgi:uncharacterized membrane protein required for colicin V production
VLNFDFIIIIIILFSVIYGFIRGVFKEVKASFALICPIIILYFIKDTIVKYLMNISSVNKVMTFMYKLASKVFNITADDFNVLLISIMIFILLSGFIKFIFNLISPSKIDIILKTKKKSSRIIGGTLGLIKAYFLIMLALMLIKPVSSINYKTPVTNQFVKINKPLYDKLGTLLLELPE